MINPETQISNVSTEILNKTKKKPKKYNMETELEKK